MSSIYHTTQLTIPARDRDGVALKQRVPGKSAGILVRGNNLARCCGIYEIGIATEIQESYQIVKEILLNKEAYMEQVVGDFIVEHLGTGCRKSTSGDYVGPTMFVITDYVPPHALATPEQWAADIEEAYKLSKSDTGRITTFGSPLHNLLAEYFKPFYMAQFLAQNSKYGTLVKGGEYRSNGNYRRQATTTGKESMVNAGLKAKDNISQRHMLNCWVWQPNQDLITDHTYRVYAYKTLKDVFSVYNTPKAAPKKVTSWEAVYKAAKGS
jgi:hypothetical protein